MLSFDKLRPLGLALFLAIAPVACTSAGARSSDGLAERPLVQVDNQRFSDINVYVLNGGQKVRLGRVGAKRTGQFTMPSGIVQRARDVEFLVESLSGGSQAVTQRIWVAPGEHVRLVVP